MVQMARLRRFGATGGLGFGLLGGMIPVMIAHARQAAPPQATASAPLVFRGVTVIDVRMGQRLPNQTVVIVGTRFQTLGRSGTMPVPKGARVVDARGKFLIPGLWDMHVHPYHYVDVAYPLLLANGVTGVRDAGSSVPLDTLNQWKREIAAGTRVGPRYLVSGPILDTDSSHTIVYLPTNTPDTLEEKAHAHVPPALARYAVDSLKAGGADFIKMRGVSSAMYLAMAAEARRVGIPFGGHLPEGVNGVDGRMASDSGTTWLDHEPWMAVCGEGTDFDAAQCRAAAERLRHNNTWVTVMPKWNLLGGGRAQVVLESRRYCLASFRSPWPMSHAEVAASRPPASTTEWLTPPEQRNDADGGYNSSQQFARWHAAGIPMVVGTDATMGKTFWTCLFTPGVTVPRALVSFVLAGMTPLEALQTATLNPALALRATDSLGTVAAGKVADVVLLDADPLTDIWNVSKIRAVVANGRYYDRATLDRLLLQAELEAAQNR